MMSPNAARKTARDQALSTPGWMFIHQNPRAGRTYGNAAIYATPQSLESLVRETLQNSLDAKIDGRVSMRMTLYELPRSSTRYKKFMVESGIDPDLKKRVAASAEAAGSASQFGIRLSTGTRVLEAQQQPLRLLKIEDFGARGLGGEENGRKGAFAALVRDEEHSDKANQNAGGLFGVGSKTLFSASQIMTVFFASRVAGEEGRGIRLIGKSHLGNHAVGQQEYAGQGWWGVPDLPDGAVSVWDGDAQSHLGSLLLDRVPPKGEKRQTGSSMLIVGFSEDHADDQTGEEVVERIARAAAEYFWPAMLRGELRAQVGLIKGDHGQPAKEIDVDPKDWVPSFVDAFQRQARNELSAELEKPGDTVSLPIPWTVPATTPEGGADPQHPQVPSEARLVIRLPELSAVDRDLVDHVGFTRGLGMITKYVAKRNLAAGVRPFHAFVLAGLSAGKGKGEEAAEHFLRFSEPPSHNSWGEDKGARKSLKQRYAHGALRHLESFMALVYERLREYVSGQQVDTDEAPPELSDIFKLETTPPTPPEPKVRITHLGAPFRDGEFHVSATLSHEADGACVLDAKLIVEKETRNRPIGLLWTDLEVSPGKVKDGLIYLPRGAKKTRIRGRAILDPAKTDLRGLRPELCGVRMSVSLHASETGS